MTTLHSHAGPDRQMVLAGVVACLALAWIWLQASLLTPVAAMTPDSDSYLNFYPVRSAGYPAFLKVFGAQGAVLVQPILFALALGLFAIETLRLTGSLVVPITLCALMVLNPEVNKLHLMIMTESVFLTLLVVFLAGLVRFARRPDLSSAALISIAAGLAATVRPTGYALFVVVPFIVLIQRRRLRGSLRYIFVAALLPMFLIVAAERAFTNWFHGKEATSLAGHVFFAKAAIIEAPSLESAENDPVRRMLFHALENDFAPVRALIARAPTGDIRRLLVVNYESCAEWSCVDELRSKTGLSAPVLNDAALRVALARIVAAPFNYLSLVWEHYRSMWVLYARTHPALAPAYVRFIAENRPLPFEAFVSPLLEDAPSSRLAVVVRPLFIAFAWSTGILAALGLVALMRGNASPAMAVSFAAAASVHASLILTAMLGVGIVRYTLSTWPAIMTALVFALWWLATLWRPAPTPAGANPDYERTTVKTPAR
jgi:hypothetical protein